MKHSMLLAVMGAAAFAAAPAAFGRSGPAGENTERFLSPEEAERLIDEVGRTPPPWWDSVRPEHPSTLDLSWKTLPGWRPRHNLEAYLFSVVRPNPEKWKAGVRLLHKALVVNKNDPRNLRRTMKELAGLYQLLGDWARAAFWWKKSGDPDPAALAECYWHLHCPEAARKILSSVPEDTAGAGAVIRLWGKMGEIECALALAEKKARSGEPDIAWLAAGDVLRSAGRFKEAAEYYRKVLDCTGGSRNAEKNKDLAKSALKTLRAFEMLDISRIPDGIYRGSAPGYRGDVKVEVTVRGGEIASVRVTEHREDAPLSALTEIPAEIEAKQGVRNVDAVSGATITSEAVINAAAAALSSGMR